LKARDASFKSAVSSIRANLILCCDGGKSLLSYTSPEGLICEKGNQYPGSVSVKNIIINNDCKPDGYFSVTLEPGSKNTGNCSSAIINNTQSIFNGC
jgi:hypothetical protein